MPTIFPLEAYGVSAPRNNSIPHIPPPFFSASAQAEGGRQSEYLILPDVERIWFYGMWFLAFDFSLGIMKFSARDFLLLILISLTLAFLLSNSSSTLIPDKIPYNLLYHLPKSLHFGSHHGCILVTQVLVMNRK